VKNAFIIYNNFDRSINNILFQKIMSFRVYTKMNFDVEAYSKHTLVL